MDSGGPHEAVIVATSAAEVRFTSMAALYERHSADAVRLAYFLVGDPGLAEELVQDAFVRVFARLDHLRDPDSLWPYICRTVANLAHKHFRRQRIERTFLRSQAGGEPTVGDQAPSLAARDELWRALQTLPERQRVALVLRFYADLSEDQTAGMLRCSTGAVNSLVARGLAAMRQKIGTDDA